MDLERQHQLDHDQPACSEQIPENENQQTTDEDDEDSLQLRFDELRRQTQPLFVVLGKTPNTELEEALTTSSSIKLNSQLVQAGEDLLTVLQSQVDERRVETEALWNEVCEWRNKLANQDNPQLGYTNAHCRIYQVMQTLKAEYVQIEAEKTKRLVDYISCLRVELSSLWDKCMISEEERHQFTEFSSENFNEALLRIHQEELNKWKVYYEKSLEVLKKMKQREEMWQTLKELEAKQDDPSRFINRGGALLKDQENLTRIKKHLPKLEMQLKKLATKFEHDHGRKITIHGQDIPSLIDTTWQLYENEKFLKRQATRAKIRQSVAPSQSGSVAAASTTSKAGKRAPPTPTLPGSKRRCLAPISIDTPGMKN